MSAAPNAIVRVARYVRPRLRNYAIGLFVFALTEVSFYISLPLMMKILIDAALARDIALLWRGVGFVLALSVCGGASFVLFMYLFTLTVGLLTADIRKRCFKHTLRLPLSYFENKHSGDIVSRLTNDIAALKNSYDWPLWNLLVTLINGGGAVVAMLVLDWRVSSPLIISSLVFSLLNANFAKAIGKTSAKIQSGLGKLTEALGNALAGFSVIKQFRLEKTLSDQYELHNRALRDAMVRRARQAAWLDVYNTAIGWISFGGILSLGAVLAGGGFVGFGTMVALTNLLWGVNRMIRDSGGLIAQFQGYLAGAERVEELRAETPEDEAAPESAAEEGGATLKVLGPADERSAASERAAGWKASEAAAGNVPVRVDISDLSFAYGEKDQTLRGINLEVDAGAFVGLAGPSGGGKSTILKLLLGFYRPAAGRVLLNGRPADELPLARLRDYFAYVPQDVFLFDATLAENIACGRPDASPEAVERAARAAGAHTFIGGLEKGYETVVGERGVRLSGGQRQRIAIARALLKDAPILLFDEATSSLDSSGERLIQDAILSLGGGKTVLAVAHRLSTIENADDIYVIDAGTVAERGKHHELLARGGLYKKLYDKRFEPSREAASDRC